MNRFHRSFTATSLVFVASLGVQSVAAEPPAFRTQVAPIFERHCVRCHNDEDRKGGLSLSSAEAVRKGGDSGAAFISSKPAESLLIQNVEGGEPEMPKNAPPLTPAQVATLRQWIETGADWPGDLRLRDKQFDGQTWWSLKPLVRPRIPEGIKVEGGGRKAERSRQSKVKTSDSVPSLTPPSQLSTQHSALSSEYSVLSTQYSPIDAFIRTTLYEKGLTFSPESDRRTLYRRLSFDLLGLPPDPDEVDAFVADPDPTTYERLVDQMLASPRYGERWARHWLDIVHYGDTHGYDKDKLRPNAWPYRDYVIRSLNEDKPYDRFVLEQLAGDVLWPDTVDGITATGFIAAGPWDFIGHAEVPESKIDGKIARNLDRDDMVTTTLNTFCSLTVQCARCHNHKFDPVTQTDYYRLQANFAAIDRADRMYDVDPAVGNRRVELLAEQRRLKGEEQRLASEVAKLCGDELKSLDQKIAAAQLATAGQRRPEYGYHSGIEQTRDKTKWVQVDLGREMVLSKISYIGCWDDFNGIGAGFGFPVRFKIEASNDVTFVEAVTMLVDQTGADFVNPGTTLQQSEVKDVTARFVRVTATKLAPRQNDFICAMAELQVFDADGKNVAAGATVTALDSIEAPIRWSKKNLVDGIFPGQSAEDVNALREQRTALVLRLVPQIVRNQIKAVEVALTTVNQQMATLPAPQYVYAGMIHTGGGAFSGTGPFGGKPRTIRILKRGDVTSEGDEVGPGAVPLRANEPGEFVLPPNHKEGDRRVALARWIVDEQHPLTWRSIVNRVWQHHFGRGIVDSPNDFGRMGQLPTHPELLDWLAVEFRDGGRSLKQFHRRIVTSHVYRQQSLTNETAEQIDSSNSHLWRANRRKLDAEALRDSMLFVAGRLDDRMGGPAFQDFVVEKPEHSPHYEYRLHDAEDPRSHRRSIYRFLVRSQTQPFMTTLDCADPSMIVDKRNETVTALQALALLNNKLVLSMSAHMAERLEATGTDPLQQVVLAFRLAIGRSPTAEERIALVEYAAENGLAQTCRVIFNLNEFAFVD